MQRRFLAATTTKLDTGAFWRLIAHLASHAQPDAGCPQCALLRSAYQQDIARRWWGTLLLAARQKGQGMVEYALLLVLIAGVVVVALAVQGGQLRNVFLNLAASL